MAASFPIRRLTIAAALVFGLVASAMPPKQACAQRRGGGGGFPGGMGGMHGRAPGGVRGEHGSFPRGNGGPPPNTREHPNASSTIRPGLQLGPPGRWWDDKHFARQLHLSKDQQQHMDAIFEQNRPSLLKRFEGLKQEEQKMEALTHANSLDENALFAQIERVAQARADLEKANTHLLFQLRNEMDAGQLSQLEDHH